MESSSNEVQYDADALPTEIDVQTYFEVQSLRDELAGVSDAVSLMAQSDGDKGDDVSSDVALDVAQYQYLQRSMQLGNTLGLVTMMLIGILCGLVAWNAFTHSWGSHG